MTNSASHHHRHSAWPVFTGLILALLASCMVALLFGAERINLREGLDSPILHIRLARILLGIIAGAGLSVAGVVFQALLRNPLAEPYLLGVSSGAGLGAAIGMLIGVQAMGLWTVPGCAFIGGFITLFVVYGLARRPDGSVPTHSLLLAGVIMGAILGSILMFMVDYYSTVGKKNLLHNVIGWLMGDLQCEYAELLYVVGGIVAVGIAFAGLFARDLNVITLGEEPAAHLGMDVEKTKVLLFIVASLIAGAIVSACGIIGFVGLIVPHTMRMMLGPDHRRLLPASALAGAIMLILADTLARTIRPPMEIPIGVVTACIGGPFFLILLRRKKHTYWG